MVAFISLSVEQQPAFGEPAFLSCGMEKVAKQFRGVQSPKDEAAHRPNRGSEVFKQHQVKDLQAQPLGWCTPPGDQELRS